MLVAFTSFARQLFVYILLLCFVIALIRCSQEVVPELFKPNNAHEAYTHKLEKSDLLSTSIGKSWIAAEARAFPERSLVTLPYKESFFIDPYRPTALGYIFSVKRGEKIHIQASNMHNDSIELFADVFRYQPDNTNNHLLPVASLDPELGLLSFEPHADGDYFLRLQPELLLGGRFELSIYARPIFEFPVLGKDKKSIGSFFGDPRDGGRREHHGIDIFAKRHTPIIAPVKGYINFVGERGLGGQVVWMKDQERDMTLYFAHLETIYAKAHTRVDIGDTLGTVGNTGNARTTPPHLHFGIYKNGPIDPYHFVANKQSIGSPIKFDKKQLGRFKRLKRSLQVDLIAEDESPAKRFLPKYQIVQIEAAMNDQLRVILPNDERGQLSMKYVEELLALDSKPVQQRHEMRMSPNVDSPILAYLEVNERYQVLGSHGEFEYIVSNDGIHGWITQPV